MSEMKARFESLLCYSGLLAFLFLKSKDDFVRFHAKQGVALFITAMISLLIPVIGWIFVWPFVFVSCMTGAVKAWDYKIWKAPVIWKIPFFKGLLKEVRK